MAASTTDIHEEYEKSFEQAMEMLESGHKKQDILNFLVYTAEKAAGSDTVSSILVLDKDGLLRNAASPGLPSDYINKIDGLKPNARVGTCAAAAATSSIIITEDFCADDKWEELRHLPLALGFKSAWSMPILNDRQKVIGTFGTYFYQHRTPTIQEIAGVKLLANAAAKILGD
ncbi:GAF domain-containing protein [Daejeonella sp. JGW-45]|uniref:GAF domain-containing protein n=1 Tax=Daejeonella sp. JGW-45 TaxID=3034148 RepID=UPI0023EBD43B|nr:GAF domain-containing protein [Daejeonella sp. JGW-45]